MNDTLVNFGNQQQLTKSWLTLAQGSIRWVKFANQYIPVSAIPILIMGALCLFGKSSGAAVNVNEPSSLLVILKTRIVSSFASHAMKALQ